MQHPARLTSRVHQITDRHFQLVAELERLHPEAAPIIHYHEMAPGSESIETVSVQLYQRLRKTVIDPLFVAFCHLNSERLIDYLEHRLELDALPLDVDEIVAEVYFRLHRQLRHGESIDLQSPGFQWKSPKGLWTVFHMLAAAGDAVIVEQREVLRSNSLPLPGICKFKVNPSKQLTEQVQEMVAGNNARLKEEDVLHWAAHALLHLPSKLRRALLLRSREELSTADLAKRLGVQPLEAARLLTEARTEFHDRILSTLVKFHPPSESAHTKPVNRSDDFEESEDTDGDD